MMEENVKNGIEFVRKTFYSLTLFYLGLLRLAKHKKEYTGEIKKLS